MSKRHPLTLWWLLAVGGPPPRGLWAGQGRMVPLTGTVPLLELPRWDEYAQAYSAAQALTRALGLIPGALYPLRCSLPRR